MALHITGVAAEDALLTDSPLALVLGMLLDQQIAEATALMEQGDPTTPAPGAVTKTDGCIASIPDPGTTAPVDICYSLYRPAGATSATRVPMILHSHGWGGSRTTDAASFAYLTDAGFGQITSHRDHDKLPRYILAVKES